jgi:hypothetical protein
MKMRGISLVRFIAFFVFFARFVAIPTPRQVVRAAPWAMSSFNVFAARK